MNLRGAEVEKISSVSVDLEITCEIPPSLFLWEGFNATGWLVDFVLSVVVEVAQSTVTIVGIGFSVLGIGFVSGNESDIVSFDSVLGGLCAASRLLFGKTVRFVLVSDVTRSFYKEDRWFCQNS